MVLSPWLSFRVFFGWTFPIHNCTCALLKVMSFGVNVPGGALAPHCFLFSGARTLPAEDFAASDPVYSTSRPLFFTRRHSLTPPLVPRLIASFFKALKSQKKTCPLSLSCYNPFFLIEIFTRIARYDRKKSRSGNKNVKTE